MDICSYAYVYIGVHWYTQVFMDYTGIHAWVYTGINMGMYTEIHQYTQM